MPDPAHAAGRNGSEKILTFRELEALACFRTSRFLTLDSAGVAGHEALGAESSLVVGVDFDESAGDGEAKSFCLAFVAAAVEVYVDVVLFGCIQSVEGLLNNILED